MLRHKLENLTLLTFLLEHRCSRILGGLLHRGISYDREVVKILLCQVAKAAVVDAKTIFRPSYSILLAVFVWSIYADKRS